MHRVLVVEDDAAVAQLLVDVLESHGHRVIAVHDARSAYDVIDRNLPDLILLDLMLPDADGLALLNVLKTAHQQVPIVVISARSAQVDQVLCRHLGAADFIAKPFDLDDFDVRIAAALSAGG